MRRVGKDSRIRGFQDSSDNILKSKCQNLNVKKVDWFSLEKIKNCKEVIFPVLLPKYLPDIMAEKYPSEPTEIDLGKQPE